MAWKRCNPAVVRLGYPSHYHILFIYLQVIQVLVWCRQARGCWVGTSNKKWVDKLVSSFSWRSFAYSTASVYPCGGAQCARGWCWWPHMWNLNGRASWMPKVFSDWQLEWVQEESWGLSCQALAPHSVIWCLTLHPTSQQVCGFAVAKSRVIFPRIYTGNCWAFWFY